MTAVIEAFREVMRAAQRFGNRRLAELAGVEPGDIAQMAIEKSLKAKSGVMFCRREDVARYANVAVRHAAIDEVKRAARRPPQTLISESLPSPLPSPEEIMDAKRPVKPTPKKRLLLGQAVLS